MDIMIASTHKYSSLRQTVVALRSIEYTIVKCFDRGQICFPSKKLVPSKTKSLQNSPDGQKAMQTVYTVTSCTQQNHRAL